MPGQQDDIGDDAAIADVTIVGDMTGAHEIVVAADSGDSSSPFGSDVDGDVFPDGVSVTNDDSGAAALELEILRRGADDDIGGDDVVAPYDGISLDGDAVGEARSGAYLDILPYDTIRPDGDAFGKASSRLDDRGCMNCGAYGGTLTFPGRPPDFPVTWRRLQA